MDTRQRVRQVVADLLNARDDRGEFADSDSLLLSGRLQSIDAVNVGLFLEQEYGVDFASLGFDQAQVDSINEIVSLIERNGNLPHE
jgi:acyl carrier protein